jgi:hypothetical protein
MRTTAIGIIDLDVLPPMDQEELVDLIKRDLAGLPEEDQKEIMEIAEDLFTDEELKTMLSGDFIGDKL